MSNDALRLINLNLKYQNFFAALIRWTKLVVSAWKKKYCPIASRCFCDKTSKVNTPDSITILHFCSYLIQIYLTAWCFWFHETLINVLLYLTIYWMYFFHYSCLKSYVCPNRRTQTLQTWPLEYLIAASSILSLQVKTPAWSWFISKSVDSSSALDVHLMNDEPSGCPKHFQKDPFFDKTVSEKPITKISNPCNVYNF